MTVYDKPAVSTDEHIELLRKRGLLIPDELRAKAYLANISYFRLSAYARPFYRPNQPNHHFIQGTTFEDVLKRYVFDRELRLLLLDAIERLEVALRAQVTNTLGEHHGPHGYLQSALFDSQIIGQTPFPPRPAVLSTSRCNPSRLARLRHHDGQRFLSPGHGIEANPDRPA